MPNLRIDGSDNQFHRPDYDAPGAWLTAAVAVAIMVGVILVLPERSYEDTVTQQATLMNMPELVTAVP